LSFDDYEKRMLQLSIYHLAQATRHNGIAIRQLAITQLLGDRDAKRSSEALELMKSSLEKSDASLQEAQESIQNAVRIGQ
jgi:hypothetical protein